VVLGRVRRSPLAAVAIGLASGVLGTLAMTGWQELSARLFSSDEDGSSSAAGDPWDEAPAPAQVARKAARLVGVDPSPERIPLITNVMHWGYGTSWGAVYGLAARNRRVIPLSGLAFGAGVWAMSYLQLVPMGIYEPPWKYSPGQLALDLSYHLVYGGGTELGYRIAGAAA
jgi:hypothetical protein